MAPRWLAALMLTVLGCGRQPPAPILGFDERHATPPARDTAAPRPAFDRPAMVAFHMRRHFDDLRAIESMVLAGKLRDARALAFLLTRPPPDPAFTAWTAETARVADAAIALSDARSLGEACRRIPRVWVACAECHQRAQAVAVFGPPPPLPPSRATPEALLARHHWAVDRLWEAMVGGSAEAWRGALEILADTPPPSTARPDGDHLARQLRERARAQLASPLATSLDQRAVAYGELLVTCAACHATASR